jgi:hypothetical protein
MSEENEYINNQYITLMSLSDVKNIKIKIDKRNQEKLEDIDIDLSDGREINGLIYIVNEKRIIDLHNIYYSVKTLITNSKVIYDRWMEIPEHIENIVILTISKSGEITKIDILKNNKSRIDYLPYTSTDIDKLRRILFID